MKKREEQRPRATSCVFSREQTLAILNAVSIFGPVLIGRDKLERRAVDRSDRLSHRDSESEDQRRDIRESVTEFVKKVLTLLSKKICSAVQSN